MYLKDFQKEFDPLLVNYLQNKIESLLPFSNDKIIDGIIENLIPFQSEGKRIRPFLVKTLYSAYGGIGEDINQIIISNELLHAMALVHDDIMDQGNMRHGQLTYHKKIADLYKGNEHAGISQGILVGDRLLSRSIENIIFSSNNKAAIKDFMQMIEEVIMGQVIDVHFSHIHNEVSLSQIKTKDKLKSGYYTFMRPMKLGGILAGVDGDTLKNIVNFGETLGLGYQMRDDLLDITGTHGHDNKTRFSDLSEGNQTVVLYEVVKRVSKEEKSIILSHRGKEINDADIAKLSKIIEKSGALDAVKIEINRLLDDSQMMLDSLLPTSKNEHTALKEIIDYLRV